MTDPQPPAFCMNPWAAGGDTITLVRQGVRLLIRRTRVRREIRSLNRIAVLQSGWDTLGRHTQMPPAD